MSEIKLHANLALARVRRLVVNVVGGNVMNSEKAIAMAKAKLSDFHKSSAKLSARHADRHLRDQFDRLVQELNIPGMSARRVTNDPYSYSIEIRGSAFGEAVTVRIDLDEQPVTGKTEWEMIPLLRLDKMKPRLAAHHEINRTFESEVGNNKSRLLADDCMKRVLHWAIKNLQPTDVRREQTRFFP
jgi:hypothetical protein